MEFVAGGIPETIAVVCKDCGKTHEVMPAELIKDHSSLIPAYYYLCPNCSYDNKVSLKGTSKEFKRDVKRYNRIYL